jgi:hypothetical protein
MGRDVNSGTRRETMVGCTAWSAPPRQTLHSMMLFEVAREIARRQVSLFVRGPDGQRPVFGDREMFQNDPHWRDCPLFSEYFHGDDGRGLGASHQTGWTGLVAKLIQLFGAVAARDVLEADGSVVFLTTPRPDLKPSAPPPCRCPACALRPGHGQGYPKGGHRMGKSHTATARATSVIGTPTLT